MIFKDSEANSGSTQFRISFIETPQKMDKIRELFVKLLRESMKHKDNK